MDKDKKTNTKNSEDTCFLAEKHNALRKKGLSKYEQCRWCNLFEECFKNRMP